MRYLSVVFVSTKRKRPRGRPLLIRIKKFVKLNLESKKLDADSFVCKVSFDNKWVSILCNRNSSHYATERNIRYLPSGIPKLYSTELFLINLTISKISPAHRSTILSLEKNAIIVGTSILKHSLIAARDTLFLDTACITMLQDVAGNLPK